MSSFRTITLTAALFAGATLAAVSTANAAGPDGTALFAQRCKACHAVAAGAPATIGPNLRGVVGRKAASGPFAYSDALKKSALNWDKATLDKFLTAPAKLVPGTRMAISVSDPAQRKALIDYLATQR